MLKWTHRFSDRLHLPLTHLQRLRVRHHPFSSRNSTHWHSQRLRDLSADGAAASLSRFPKQKRVTQQIMPRWMPHVHSNQAPPDDFCNHLRKLHLTQVVEAAPDAEAGDLRHSILGAGMGEGDQSRKLSYSPKPAA